MENKYKVKVNDTFEYEFNKEEITNIDSQQLSASSFHILQNDRSFKLEILSSNFLKKTYSVKINSNIYEVNISNELDLLIEEMGLSLGSAQVMNDIKAPMPGLILDVLVKEGDSVKEGDYLLVLEAMKMENTLTAPGDGVIKAIHVEKGQTVEKNQLLIELE
ncbi:acetyl-CoA carboxylase biotin carboxyl carrier protein subunit [Gillisia sp. M10.2A]|uniref:Acetyl-CoA carboxylase biotin carboxyl carrier protein subunit n=1 Tax=Gillisia lutea TaxID=2909668 RepID=A0ABS9EI45_9FLAO|nr:acetyl-CoA carboxylase biotin carboxyl carrier protein subunit [Gillisia lutea]MCF4101859.1 acetyl-CoA carboxylase biotin carboxyl carrier protein subunit [Gillisia lutea]